MVKYLRVMMKNKRKSLTAKNTNFVHINNSKERNSNLKKQQEQGTQTFFHIRIEAFYYGLSDLTKFHSFEIRT